MPALLATAAVHHHLIRQGLRMQTGLVVETGEAREVHHFCVLAGYGAEAINPYLAFETLEQIRVAERPAADALRGAEELHQGGRQGHPEGDVQDGHLDLPVLLRRADLRRGRPVERRSSRSTSPAPRPRSKASACARSPRKRCAATATPMATTRSTANMLDVGGDYAFRLRGEDHAWTPESSPSCSTRCAATCPTSTRPSPQTINDQSERLLTIRGLMEFKFGRPADRRSTRSSRPPRSSSASPPAR